MDKHLIGSMISLMRREKGLTGERFGELLGVSPQAVSKWENGKCLPETSMLPLISGVLGVSIDSLLMPKKLIVLNAVYSDGEKQFNVTQILNNHVIGNRLSILVNAQFLGVSLDTQRIGVLTVKYQTPNGTFFTYALQDEPLTIELTDVGYAADTPFEIIGAYYGNKDERRPAMDRMKHYDYFRWNEIPVNHETFPSSPSADAPEYLTLVYLNAKGIHVISCAENETLCYSADRTELYLKDTSTCILPGIMTLEWEAGMDCTWAGAIYAALRYTGEPYTYEQIWAERIDKDDRSEERMNIVRDIANGKPVIAINLRVAPEWGVITGYSENGKVLYCRTYFDKEDLNENKDYLVSEFWPFLIVHFGEKTAKPSDLDNLIASLHTLVGSFGAECSNGYFQGAQAYEKWIAGLRNEQLWDQGNAKDDVERRLAVNDCMLLNLVDARRCAAAYLSECVPLLRDERADLLAEIASLYRGIAEQLSSFRSKVKTSDGESLRYNAVETKVSTRFLKEQASLLESVLQVEREIAERARKIIA